MTRQSLFRSPWIRWGLLAVIQLGLIAVPLLDRLEVVASGTEVTLDFRPVDPRDLLRGDYVIVSLKIEALDPAVPGLGENPSYGDTVYVVLEQRSGAGAAPVAVLTAPPDDGRLALKGTVRHANGPEGAVMIDYGIDAFFVPEGEGLEIEKLPADRVQLVVALAADGRAVPLRLLVDGKEFQSDGLL